MLQGIAPIISLLHSGLLISYARYIAISYALIRVCTVLLTSIDTAQCSDILSTSISQKITNRANSYINHKIDGMGVDIYINLPAGYALKTRIRCHRPLIKVPLKLDRSISQMIYKTYTGIIE